MPCATHADILTSLNSTSPHDEASMLRQRSPTVRLLGPIASVVDLSPVTFSAQNHSTSELLRTLLMVAASKPTSWLSGQFYILYHLAYTSGP